MMRAPADEAGDAADPGLLAAQVDAAELTGTNRSGGLATFCTNRDSALSASLEPGHSIQFVIVFAGGYSGGATPVPIPNTEVKPSSAHGTALVTGWESRSLPAFFSAAFFSVDEAQTA